MVSDVYKRQKYYGLHFDSESKYFYVISEQKIVRVYIANHEKEEFSLPILRNQIWINTWRILEEDVLLIVLNDAELLMLDTKKDLECVFYHKLKGLYLADYSLENGEVLILSQSKKADGYVAVSYTHLYERYIQEYNNLLEQQKGYDRFRADIDDLSLIHIYYYYNYYYSPGFAGRCRL